jgi:hypothetical protein
VKVPPPDYGRDLLALFLGCLRGFEERGGYLFECDVIAYVENEEGKTEVAVDVVSNDALMEISTFSLSRGTGNHAVVL